MIKLKACPFCGSESVSLDTDGHMTWVLCLTCDSRGRRYFNSNIARRAAAEAWNTRVDPITRALEDDLR